MLDHKIEARKWARKGNPTWARIHVEAMRAEGQPVPRKFVRALLAALGKQGVILEAM